MPQYLNSYQDYIIRELSRNPKQFNEIIRFREFWLMINNEFPIERLLSWEIEMLLDDFIIVEDDLLLRNIDSLLKELKKVLKQIKSVS